MQVQILRVDGTTETITPPRHQAIKTISAALGCSTCDVVNLRDGRVMLVDDTGMVDGKPVNPKATAIYHGVYSTPYSIHGDAAIANDEDFA